MEGKYSLWIGRHVLTIGDFDHVMHRAMEYLSICKSSDADESLINIRIAPFGEGDAK